MYPMMLFITKMKSQPSSDEVLLESKIRGVRELSFATHTLLYNFFFKL